MKATAQVEPIVASVQETCQLLGLGRTKVDQMVADGTLKSMKAGRRRLVLRSSIMSLFETAA